MNLEKLVRTIPNYPKEEIMFRDITTLLADAEGFSYVIDHFAKRAQTNLDSLDAIVGIEARGFILGAALAYKLKRPFIPVRKAGKLPGETLGVDYDLEYGTDRVEIHKDVLLAGSQVVLVDDLLATGGTALAAAKLLEMCQVKVQEAYFVINLPDLEGDKNLAKANLKCYSLIDFKGH